METRNRKDVSAATTVAEMHVYVKVNQIGTERFAGRKNRTSLNNADVHSNKHIILGLEAKARLLMRDIWVARK